MKQRAVFLDRDGTIMVDSNYVGTVDQVQVLDGAVEALRRLREAGYRLFVITNQSALARRLISRQGLNHIHRMMRQVVESNGGKIKDILYCPHMPHDYCDCRKPEPGLIFKAQRKCGIDLASAAMVGDSARDIECARNAGCGYAVLVKTGIGDGVERHPAGKKIVPDCVAQDLYQAARWIIDNYS